MNVSVPLDLMEVSPSVLRTAAVRGHKILVVSSSNTAHVAVRSILPAPEWEVRSAFELTGALLQLQNVNFGVVLCDHELGGLGWVAVLEATNNLLVPPRLVVFSRCADHLLWGEVLNLGCYDLLEFPFVREELSRVAALAAGSWAMQARDRCDIAV
jgi:DNA-binding NtrC family response regulator